jgi:hypothetical protein
MFSIPWLLLFGVAVFFAVKRRHHHGWLAFASIMFGLFLATSPLGTPVHAALDSVQTAISNVAASFGSR